MQVLKFGGTSVGSTQQIQTVVNILNIRAKKNRLVAVFSAMADVTNQIIAAIDDAVTFGVHGSSLIRMLQQRHLETLREVAEPQFFTAAEETISEVLHELDRKLNGIALLKECSPRTRDSVISIGERLSLPVIAAALRSLGIRVFEIDAAEIIRTNRQFTDAKVDLATTEALTNARLEGLQNGEIALVSGFIGGTADGDVTTLGRGGSDYSAALIGRAVHAELVEIWTDTNGVLSADPRIISDAVQLPDISYREAAEMAFFGAKVLHPKTMSPLESCNIPLIIRNTFAPEHPGTRIVSDSRPDLSPITAISSISDVSVISLVQSLNVSSPVSSTVIKALAGLSDPILLLNFGIADATIRLAVHAKDVRKIVQFLREELAEQLRLGIIRDIFVEDNLALMAIVGKPHHLQNGNLSRIFETFTRHHIPTRSVASGTSNHSLSVLLNRTDLDRAMKALHAAYFQSGAVKPATNHVTMLDAY